jgi:hemolysin activation/secretion protein
MGKLHRERRRFGGSLFAGIASCLLVSHAIAQPVPPPQSSGEQEQRRAEDRERLLRDQQERAPDIRLPQAPVDTVKLPLGESPCFNIRLLEVKTAAAHPSTSVADWEWVLSAAAGPHKDDSPVGRCLGAQGIDGVLKRVQEAVIAKGYVTTRVLAEPQDLTSGLLTLTIVPGRIHAVRLASDADARTGLWNAMATGPGRLLNLRDIEQSLENLKRVPTAEADIQIEPATGPDAQPGESDLVVSYKQAVPIRLALSLDDSGSKATGRYQGGATLSLDNLLTLNDLFYVSLNNDLGSGGQQGSHGTHGRTVHYSVPYGYWLLGATASNSNYYQTVAGANQDYVYSGNSSTMEVRLSRLVYRDAARKTTLSAKAFRRESSNFIDDTEIQNQRRVVGGFELGINHREFIGNATLDLNLAYKRGTGAFGAQPAPEELTGEGTSRMKLTTLDANLSAPFKVWDQNLRYTGQLRAQFDHSRLTPQDRFAIGGRYSVRGFDGETSLSAERGVVWRNELAVALSSSGQEVYAGVDYGRVGGPSAPLLIGTSLSGAVLGLRGGYKNLQYDLYLGRPLHKPEGFQTASATAGFSLSLVF